MGCASSPILPYDKNGFFVNNTQGLKFSTQLKTGLIKMGHSSWISAEDYSKGNMPHYYCEKPGVHDWGGHYWMFDKKNQEEFISNLNKILISNEVFDHGSNHILVVEFTRVEQGPDDDPVYTFDVIMALSKNGVTAYSKEYHFVGNKMSEEFWSFGGWGNAKAKATNRLMNLIISDFNGWFSN